MPHDKPHHKGSRQKREGGGREEGGRRSAEVSIHTDWKTEQQIFMKRNTSDESHPHRREQSMHVYFVPPGGIRRMAVINLSLLVSYQTAA
jgi:hypothetical protein